MEAVQSELLTASLGRQQTMFTHFLVVFYLQFTCVSKTVGCLSVVKGWVHGHERSNGTPAGTGWHGLTRPLHGLTRAAELHGSLHRLYIWSIMSYLHTRGPRLDSHSGDGSLSSAVTGQSTEQKTCVSYQCVVALARSVTTLHPHLYQCLLQSFH